MFTEKLYQHQSPIFFRAEAPSEGATADRETAWTEAATGKTAYHPPALCAARLAAAGVPVRLRRFAGMIHSFLHFGGRVPAAQVLPEWLAVELKPLLGLDH